ncbi:MAG: hypothetical protein ACE5DS_00835 [Kiloniellaceae bacterium]
MSAKRKSIGSDPFAAVAPTEEAQAEPAPKAQTKAERAKATFYLPPPLLAELRAAVVNVPPASIGGSLSALVERALARELVGLRRKHNGGKPFKASATAVPRGRPPGP